MLKISYNILKNFVSLTETPQKISQVLTSCGLEVATFYPTINNDGRFTQLKVGKVIQCDKHPNADKLKLLKVDIGQSEPLQVVCGAPNIAKDQTIILATIGTTIKNNNNEEFTIKEAKIRGELSQGMVCSAFEIGFGDEQNGIHVLPNYLKPGESILNYLESSIDYIYEIEITPNRGDACSHLGVARDLAAYFNRDLIYPEVTEFYTNDFPFEVTVENTDLCSKYCCAIISGIESIESPIFFKNILKSSGVQSKNAIVDILNFIMLELGQPMHAYDFDKLFGKKISIKKSNPSDQLNALNGQSYKLSEDAMAIYDEKNPICIAGVMGGADSAISSDTNKIFLESANFNPKLIRRSSKFLGIKSDSSFRFERGVANIQNLALYRAFYLFKQIFPNAQIEFAKEHIFNLEKLKPAQVQFSSTNFQKISGIDIPKERIIQILKRLEFVVKKEDGNILDLEVPTAKSDVLREIDVVEEILRIYGLDRIEENEEFSYKLNFTGRKDSKNLQLKKEVSQWLTGDEFYEIRTNPIVSSQKILANKICAEDSLIFLKNPVSIDLDVLRPSLIISSMQVALHNANRQIRQMKTFEFGRIYLKSDADLVEKDVLSMFAFQRSLEKRWNNGGEKYSIHTLLYTVEKILKYIGIKNFQRTALQDQNSIALTIDQQVFAILSGVPKSLKNNFDIEGEAFYAELDWNFISLYSGSEKIKYTAIPKLQKIERDLSFYIQEEVNYENIEKLIFENAGDYLTEIFVIDIYKDKKSQDSKKSYTLRLEFQPTDENVTSEQILKIMEMVSSTLEQKLSAIIR